MWISISTYLIIAALKKQMHSHYSIYEITQILSISVFDRTPLNEQFTENKRLHHIYILSCAKPYIYWYKNIVSVNRLAFS